MYENLKNKNLLLLHTTLQVGGAQKVLINIANEMVKYFKNVFIIADLKDDFYLKELDNKVKVINLKSKNDNFISKNIFLFFLFPYKLLKFIKKYDIDIVHLHHRSLSFAAYFITRITKTHYITTSHNVFKDKKYFSFWGKNIIAVSNKVKENLINYFGINSHKVTVIYNGIQGINFVNKKVLEKIKREINYDSEKTYISMIALLDKQKGHEILFQAIKNNIDKFKNVRFLIIGGGYREKELKEKCKFLDLCNVVKFLGVRAEIPEFIHLSSFLVLSSFWEGFPLIILESFSQKKPFIATNVGGINEIIQDGYNGFLVKSGDWKLLSEQILKLVKNKNLTNKLGMNSYKTFVSKFTLENFINNHLKYYIKVLFSNKNNYFNFNN